VTVTQAVSLRSMAKDAAERKAAERKRLKDAGYVLLPGKAAWVPKEELSRVLKYLQLLRDRHEKKAAK
jgi:hypothetical protein